MNSSSLIFMDLQIKEHRECLEKEAQEIMMLKLSGCNQRGIRCQWSISFANLLISLGQIIKRKYSQEGSGRTDLHQYESKGICREL